MPRPLAVGLLLLVTLLWGFAFVAQKSAMATLGPLSFIAVRYALGALVVVPLVLIERRRPRPPADPRDRGPVLALIVAFCLGVWLQQEGLLRTTVTNSGFLTGLYVLFVPLLGLIVFRQWPHRVAWVAMPMAIVGIYGLNGGGFDRLNLGDALVVGGAVCWAVQVLLLGGIVRRSGRPATVSALCFAVTAAMCAGGALLLERPTLSAVVAVWPEIAYSGVLSTAVAFTLQAVAQRDVPPANAAIILSAESLFAALGGAVLLGERLLPIGYAGAGLIFAAIVLVELVPALGRPRPQPLAGA